VKISTPAYDILINGMDKAILTGIAKSHGIRTPATFKSIEEIEPNLLGSEFILKSRLSWQICNNKFVKGEVLRFKNHIDLKNYVNNSKTNQDTTIIQEKVTGLPWGLEVLVSNGKILNFFAHRRLREQNPLGGYSSAAMSVIPDQFYLKKIEELLLSLNWTGVAMFEFMGDYKMSNACLIEMNCRFWGSLPVAIYSGQRFPEQLINMILGQPVQKNEYRPYVQARWTIADIIHFVNVLKLRLKKIKNIPGVWSTFVNVFFKRYHNFNTINGDWKPELAELTIGLMRKL